MAGSSSSGNRGEGSSTCLSTDAFTHFQKREQELIARNDELEEKKAFALRAANEAIREADQSEIHQANLRPVDFDQAPAANFVEGGAAGGLPSRGGLASGSASGYGSRPPSGGGLNMNSSATPEVLAPPAASSADVESLQNTVRFQKARIIALQEELDRTIGELGGRDEEVQRLKAESKSGADENKRLRALLEKGEQERERLRKQVSSTELRVKDVERENAELLKENDNVSLQLKKSESESHAKDARINRLQDDSERYKTALKEMKTNDRDKMAVDRREVERLTSEVRKLERQRSELFGAFKKQMKMIDVLKKQKAHIEAARLLSFTEDEFIRILELGDKLG